MPLYYPTQGGMENRVDAMRMLQRFVLQSAESHALSMLLGICACFFLPFQYMAVYMYIYTHREIQYTTVRTRVELQMPTLMPRTLKPKAQNPKPSILAQVLRAGPRARGCEQSCWAAECRVLKPEKRAAAPLCSSAICLLERLPISRVRCTAPAR